MKKKAIDLCVNDKIFIDNLWWSVDLINTVSDGSMRCIVSCGSCVRSISFPSQTFEVDYISTFIKPDKDAV